MDETILATEKTTPQIISTLKDEHRYFMALLNVLSEQQRLLENAQDIDHLVAEEILEYLGDYPDEFHHPREDLLFKRLQMANPETKEIIDPLLADHKEIYQQSHDLHARLSKAKGTESLDRSSLASQLKRFVQNYKKHMKDEEERVFQLALETLTEEDWRVVDSSMEFIDDPLFGTRVRHRYRRLAHTLTERIQVTQDDLVVAEYLGLEDFIDATIAITVATGRVGSIFAKRTSKTLRDNLNVVLSGIRSPTLADLAKLPIVCGKNTLHNFVGGYLDCKETLRQTARELKEPYEFRMDVLKKTLRKDWGG